METTDHYKPVTGLVYLFNLIVGTGALTMPRAFGDAGWLASLLVVTILCLVSYITATFVIEAMSLANALLKQRRYESKKVRKRQSPTDSGAKSETFANSSNSFTDNSVNTEKLPLLDYNSDDSDDHMTDQQLFEITEKVELGTMADYFLPRIGVKLFYITIAVYLFGDLAIYSAAISKSLRDVTCTWTLDNTGNETKKYSGSDPCWTQVEISRTNAYRIYLALTLLAIGPFAFFNLQKTKYLQILTTIFRWIAFLSMIAIATAVLVKGKGEGKPKIFTLTYIPNLFGVCVYSFMCHHSLPALVTPIKDKRRIFSYILTDYVLILLFYCLLSFTGIFAFGQLQDMYTLNFQAHASDEAAGIGPVPVLDYFLPLFPVFTLSSSFPIIAITLQNNLKTIFTSQESLENSSLFKRRLLYPLIAILPPFAISMATEDLEILVGIVGSYAGACIQYVFPTLLVYFARKKIINLCPTIVSTYSHMKSPFGHKLWILLVLIWSVICIALVTVDHIINFTK